MVIEESSQIDQPLATRGMKKYKHAPACNSPLSTSVNGQCNNMIIMTVNFLCHSLLLLAVFHLLPSSSAFTTPISSRNYPHRISLKAVNRKTTSSKGSIDWNLYNLQQQYKKSGGILYKQSILSPTEYSTIMMDLANLDLTVQDEKEESFATNRMGW